MGDSARCSPPYGCALESWQSAPGHTEGGAWKRFMSSRYRACGGTPRTVRVTSRADAHAVVRERFRARRVQLVMPHAPPRSSGARRWSYV